MNLTALKSFKLKEDKNKVQNLKKVFEKYITVS